MKYYILSILFFLVYTTNNLAQSDIPKSTNDSLSYSDTVWSEIAPVPINIHEVRKMIVYPEEAREDQVEGKVVVKCLVGLDGEIIKTGEITGPKVFYKEIQRVAMFLKFTPGMINGYHIKVWVLVPFLFTIK